MARRPGRDEPEESAPVDPREREPREGAPRPAPDPNAGEWLGEGVSDDAQRREAADRAGKALEADEAGGLTAAELDQRREGDGQPVDEEGSDPQEPYPR